MTLVVPVNGKCYTIELIKAVENRATIVSNDFYKIEDGDRVEDSGSALKSRVGGDDHD